MQLSNRVFMESVGVVFCLLSRAKKNRKMLSHLRYIIGATFPVLKDKLSRLAINLRHPLFLLLSVVLMTSGNLTEAKATKEKIETNAGKSTHLDILTRRLNYNPDDVEVGDKLRDHCRRKSMSLDCIERLNKLTKRHPKNKFLRYQAALAYVDEVPGHSLIRQGWLSSRSMEHMTEVIGWEPDDWLAYYIRGLNGLYWPTFFRKLPGAIKDLEFCIRLSDKLPKGLLKPYHLFAFIALGDAYVKDGNVSKGLEIYKKGLSSYESKELNKRLKMAPKQLIEYVEELRHTDQQVDTGISFLLDGGANKL